MTSDTSTPRLKPNLHIYETPDVSSHYAALDYISAAEKILFNAYIQPGSAILDLGVGGGRTSSFLAERSTRYVGVDYSASMVRACRSRLPELEFVVADATDLSEFQDSSFDAVVFAFNGIDYIGSPEDRKAAEAHIRRVLKPGGVFIFSSHNPRAILARPRWNRERMRKAARRLSGGISWLKAIMLAGMTCAVAGLAIARSVASTFSRGLRRLFSQAYWREEGYLVDPVHGGLITCYRTPEKVITEMVSLRFRMERVLGDDYPDASSLYATDWYYYVFSKPGIG